jgi:hypothetical protein
MNSDGDFYIGNKKLSSKTGKEVIFDAPIPTITGENTSRLSVVFDEVTIKERLLVEGGASNKVLSQFDGPVTFNNEIKINNTTTFTKPVIIKDTTSSPDKNNGALVVKGGVGIGENINVGGILNVTGASILSSTLGVTGATTLYNTLGVSGTTTLSNTLGVSGATTLSTLSVTGVTSFSNTLNVTGISTFNTDITVQGDLYLGKNSGSHGNIYFYNDSADNYNSTIQFTDTATTINSNSVAADTFYFSNRIFVDGQIETNGDITAYSTSDQRLKDNIAPIPNALEKVISISGNTFDWVQGSGKEGSDVGVIAQEILEVLPEAVTTRETGYLAVRYEKLVPLLIEAIKDLKAEIDQLKAGK